MQDPNHKLLRAQWLNQPQTKYFFSTLEKKLNELVTQSENLSQLSPVPTDKLVNTLTKQTVIRGILNYGHNDTDE